jgi:hypothetical protein
MSKNTTQSAFERPAGDPSMIEGLIEAFSSTTNRVVQAQPVDPLTSNFNSQTKPNPDTTPDMNVIQKALETKAPLVVEKNKTFTANTNPETIRQDIDNAGANVEAANKEIEKLDQPGVRQSFSTAVAGGKKEPDSPGRALGGAIIGNAATGGLTNVALNAAGMTHPMVPIALTAATVVKTAYDVSRVGQGTYGAPTPSGTFEKAPRGRNSERSGYSDALTSTPATPIMNRFNEMMGRIPGMTASFSRRDIESTGTTLAAQEIKLGEAPLDKIRSSLSRLETRVALADTALTRRGAEGAVVGVDQAAEAVLTRDMNLGAVKVADDRRSVRIFNNMA